MSERTPNRTTRGEHVLIRLKKGDQQALEELIDEFRPRLMRYVQGLVGTKDDAADVVQETFVSVWRSRAGWRGTGSATVYLFKIARNLSMNMIRSRGAMSRRNERLKFEMEVDRPLNPDQHLESHGLRARVEAALAQLSPRRREVLILTRFEGMSYEEIAYTLGISKQTVANQVSMALSDLRTHLSSEAFSLAEDAPTRGQ